MAKFEIGQQVFVRNYERYRINENTTIIPGVVTKVGRKYIHVKLSNHWNDMKFRIETPRVEVDDFGYSPDYVLHETKEAAENYWVGMKSLRICGDLIGRLGSLLHCASDEKINLFAHRMKEVENILCELNKDMICDKERAHEAGKEKK